MARTALPGRLTWQPATVVEQVDETPRSKSIVFELPDWPGHAAGQHVDVRLTAEDGYQAQRSYSIASAQDQRAQPSPTLLAGHRWTLLAFVLCPSLRVSSLSAHAR
jgi:hypothetical protein